MAETKTEHIHLSSKGSLWKEETAWVFSQARIDDPTQLLLECIKDDRQAINKLRERKFLQSVEKKSEVEMTYQDKGLAL